MIINHIFHHNMINGDHAWKAGVHWSYILIIITSWPLLPVLVLHQRLKDGRGSGQDVFVARNLLATKDKAEDNYDIFSPSLKMLWSWLSKTFYGLEISEFFLILQQSIVLALCQVCGTTLKQWKLNPPSCQLLVGRVNWNIELKQRQIMTVSHHF